MFAVIYKRNFYLSNFGLVALVVGLSSCRAKLDVKTRSGGPTPAEVTETSDPETVAAPEIPIPQVAPAEGKSKPVREILPSANNTVWQTRSYIKIQLSGDLAKAPTDTLVMKNLTTGAEIDSPILAVGACGPVKCVMIPASFQAEGTAFFAYGANDLSVVAEGTAEDLRMSYKLTIKDFTVFGSVDHVPSTVATGASSTLRPMGSGHISILPVGNSAVPLSYFTAFWQEQVEHP